MIYNIVIIIYVTYVGILILHMIYSIDDDVDRIHKRLDGINTALENIKERLDDYNTPDNYYS